MTNKQEGKNISRTPLNLMPGTFVTHFGTVYKIAEIMDFNSIFATEVETGKSKVLRIKEIEPLENTHQTKVTTDIADISDDDWRIAQERLAIIKPLLTEEGMSKKKVQLQAQQHNVGVATIYRWISLYKHSGVVSALIPKKRGWRQGKSRLPAYTDSIIDEVINDTYLTPQRSTVKKVIIEVKRRCMIQEISAPHDNTIRAKVAKIDERRALRGRGQKEKAKNKFKPTPGHFPHADYPLAVVQIDHTPLDICLVDDTYRLPIGRPWLTLAIDVYSRMITGYYLSFDPPSGTSVAMCIAHSILPKEAWLSLLNIEATWDVWGIMDKIHVDNGADFRSDNFLRSCEMYDINLEFRPVKEPQYGGHIERLLGTFATEIHDLPGTTFSSVKEKGDYPSDKHACLTKTDLESWLVKLFCKIYHKRPHSGIGMSPQKQWEIGVFGNSTVQGRGLPARPTDATTLLFDFLPSFKRTIQNYGVSIDGLNYYADVMRPWINASEPSDPKTKRKFIFRRDPRDISIIWFFDPEIKEYFRIPFANQALPTMSIWEHRSAKQKLKAQREDINEHSILRAITELREQVEKAAATTKRARRAQQRRREHEKKITPAQPVPTKPKVTIEDDWFDDDVSVFEDIS